MGVQGLWELLAPVGRRVSVETLGGKKLAIDASIWMIQFLKAMRDEKGEMMHNAHLLGFFRRICKLLFLRTKPIFVFDGGTPALKRHTIIARRRQRENARAKIRKTAEKLLLNHLKAQKLEELAKELKNKQHVSKGKQISIVQSVTEERLDSVHTQESIDELLAASLAAEEEENITGGNVSKSVCSVSLEDDGENEEMILPELQGNIDPTILAALPPSLQLDLLVQMRERLMAENRQKYQKVKKAPSKFSELQIQAYLKTVAFRREIDEVQRSVAGKGVGGVQTSRIASEANREFIFSSSFTGDKEVLTSVAANDQRKLEAELGTSLTSVSSNPTIACFHPASGANSEVSNDGFHQDLETYVDERGRTRVSKVRAMGIRMTRDIERNLDLMKELDQNKTNDYSHTDVDSTAQNDDVYVSKNPHEKDHDEVMSTGKKSGISKQSTRDNSFNQQSLLGSGTALEISFSEDQGNKAMDGDDDLFNSLVTGSPVLNFSLDNICLDDHSINSTHEYTKKKEVIQESNVNLSGQSLEESHPSLASEKCSDDDVDWEDGVMFNSAIPSLGSDEHSKAVTKGSLEEEAAIQEAIRRSLDDLQKENSESTSFGNAKENIPGKVPNKCENINTPLEISLSDGDRVDLCNVSLENHPEQTIIPSYRMEGLNLINNAGKDDFHVINTSESDISSHFSLETKVTQSVNDIEEPYGAFEVFGNEPVIMGKKDNAVSLRASNKDIAATMDKLNPHLVEKKILSGPNDCKTIRDAVYPSMSTKMCVEEKNVEDFVVSPQVVISTIADPNVENIRSIQTSHSEVNHGVDFEETSFMEEGNKFVNFVPSESNHDRSKCLSEDTSDAQIRAAVADLDEELLLLREENLDLGSEQRKLERNAEAVSKEMFAECQELLQMFGIPYIIAPMEAEAQCAYMELVNLVDGVITDDSDTFLFGAKRVYKNIFDDHKYVEIYDMKDIENELGLTRENLIRMALLLGSDYTEGVSGIGVVNAIEVVHAFPEEDGLRRFKEWFESPDPSILQKVNAQMGDRSSRKIERTSTNKNVKCLDENIVIEGNANGPSVDNIKQNFMEKHRNVSKNWHMPSNFPSELVISAYSFPQVDKSTETFTWGKPDLPVLRKLCWERFGWSSQKTDELLVPVLKEYNKNETQLRLDAFYSFNERFAKIRSKRVKKALRGITGNQSALLRDDNMSENSKSRDQSGGASISKNHLKENQPTSKIPRKRTKNQTGSHKSKLGVRKRRKTRSGAEESTFTSDDEMDETNKNILNENAEEGHILRKSVRMHKKINYMEEKHSSDEERKSSNSGHYADNIMENEESHIHTKNELSKTHHSEVLLNDECSKDHLLSGGGFCLNEDSIDSETEQHISRSIGEFKDGSEENKMVESELQESLPVANKGSQVTNPQVQLVSEKSEVETKVPGLTALSGLKRKRRY